MKTPLQQLAADPEVVAALAAVRRVAPVKKQPHHSLPEGERVYRCRYRDVKPTIENLLMRMAVVEEQAEERKATMERLTHHVAHLDAEVTRLRERLMKQWGLYGHEGTQRTQK